MYSRYHKGADDTFRLPENYGGVAFSEGHLSKGGSDSLSHTFEVAKPSPPPQSNPITSSTPPIPPRTSSAPPLPPVPPNARPHSDPPPKASHLPVGGKDGFPFAHGIGMEELFIIALIILLSKSEQSSDIVLCLTLLLFCG